MNTLLDPNILIGLTGLLIAVISLYFSKRQVDLAQKETKKQVNLITEKTKKAKLLFSGDDEYLDNVAKVLEKINVIIAQEIKEDNEINISNFGLDLETVMPWIKNTLLENSDLDNVQVNYKGLIINPDSEQIRKLIDGASNIKTAIVSASLANAWHIPELKFTGIDFEIKSYDVVPFFHGFVIDKKHLFISFTEVKNDKMCGGTLPYIYIKLDNTSPLNKHLFNMYHSWFDYIWRSSESKVKFAV